MASHDVIDMGLCLLCEETVTNYDDLAPGAWFGMEGSPRYVHRECALRNVVGGIGHLRDHAHWCGEMHDPDGGMSYRESAKLVDAWVREKGVPS